VCPQADAEGFSKLWNPHVSAYDRLVHAPQAALDRSMAFIRRLEVHDQNLRHNPILATAPLTQPI
jgi:hypothetical protein